MTRSRHPHAAGAMPACCYAELLDLARLAGRTRVLAITATVNVRSADFHKAMRFAITGPVAGYNGPGHDMLVFERAR